MNHNFKYHIKQINSATTEVMVDKTVIGKIYLIPYMFSLDCPGLEEGVKFFVIFLTGEWAIVSDYYFAESSIKTAWTLYLQETSQKMETITF